MRVTRDGFAVETLRLTFGDSDYHMLDWHDHLLAAGVVPVIPYNPQNTDDLKDIDYRVVDHITEHNEDAS